MCVEEVTHYQPRQKKKINGIGHGGLKPKLSKNIGMKMIQSFEKRLKPKLRDSLEIENIFNLIFYFILNSVSILLN